jgi:hypothetical protein
MAPSHTSAISQKALQLLGIIALATLTHTSDLISRTLPPPDATPSPPPAGCPRPAQNRVQTKFFYHPYLNLLEYCPENINPFNFTEVGPCLCLLDQRVPWITGSLRQEFQISTICSVYRVCPANYYARFSFELNELYCEPCPIGTFKLLAGNHRCIATKNYYPAISNLLKPKVWKAIGETMRTHRILPKQELPETDPPHINTEKGDLWFRTLQDIFPVYRADDKEVIYKHNSHPWPLKFHGHSDGRIRGRTS